jgi:hypothetical protein
MDYRRESVMNTEAIQTLVAKWSEPNGIPFKGSLISDDGCMCAQGQALHYVGGWDADRLRDARQDDADRETAKLLSISVGHAILLRRVNDGQPGAPSVVLTDPAKVLGDQAHIVLAFWRHLDRMTPMQWDAARDAARDAAWVAAGDAARDAAGDAAGDAARDARAARAAAWTAAGAAARAAAEDAARDAAWAAARAAAEDAALAAAWAAARAAAEDAALAAAGAAARAAAEDAALAAAWATNEIQGAALMRAKGQAFYFLPMFGFADPEDVMVADKEHAQ